MGSESSCFGISSIEKYGYSLKSVVDAYKIQEKIRDIFQYRKDKLAFSELLKTTEEDKILAFVSLLHLDNQQKVWLEQDGHFEEIWILLKEIYESKNKDLLQRLKEEVEALESEREVEIKVESVSGFSEAGKE